MFRLPKRQLLKSLAPPRRHFYLYHKRPTLTTLAIETSCDDTAVAVLSRSIPHHGGPQYALLFNERIASDNRAYQGINPSIAVASHNASLAKLVKRALDTACTESSSSSSPPIIGASGGKPDFVCATRGPGIMSNLAVGLNMAKGLAVAWGVPLLGVHHMQAHALTPRLMNALRNSDSGAQGSGKGKGKLGNQPGFPFLTLLVSGGHTQLIHSTGLTAHRILATTGDVAIGNMLDQAARAILPGEVLAACPDVMYGRALEAFAFAFDYDPNVESSHNVSRYTDFFRPAASRAEEMAPSPTGYPWDLPLPFRDTRRLAYSFSSIRTTVDRIVESRPDMAHDERVALARHTMRAGFQHLAGRLVLALEDVPELRDVKTLVVSGGVASNRFLRHVLESTLEARGFGGMEVVAPPGEFCTDNAAMVAWAGMEMWDAGWETDLGVLPVGRWPMEMDGGEDGIVGVGGWLKRPQE